MRSRLGTMGRPRGSVVPFDSEVWVRSTDVVVRYGVAIPSILVGLGLSYTRWYGRRWQLVVVAMLLVSGFARPTHRALVEDARPDWGYAGLMLILGATYTVTRLQFAYSAAVGVAIVAYHTAVSIRGRDGAGGARRPTRRTVAQRRPDRRPHRAGLGARGGGRHRPAEVRLRPVGRHREHGQPAGVPRRAGHDPGVRCRVPTPAATVPVLRLAGGEPEGQGSHADMVPARPR